MIICHRPVRDKIAALVSSGKFPQTSLFYGRNGCGKKAIALKLAADLLCDAPLSPGAAEAPNQIACGVCRSCTLMASGGHPDFFLVLPSAAKSAVKEQGSDPIGSIKIEQIRELKNRLAYPPLMAARQVVIVDNAELMTEATANSLLKILEEPRPHQTFILVTSRPHEILVTIRSRTAKTFFPPLTQGEVEAIVRERCRIEGQEIDETALVFYLDCFAGAPASVVKALALPHDPERLKRLVGRERRFGDAVAIAEEAANSEVEPSVFLQVLRHFALCELKNPGSDAEALLFFVDRIADAARRIDMKIKDEFVFENLFL